MSPTRHFRMIPRVGLERAIDLLWSISVYRRRLFGFAVRAALGEGEGTEPYGSLSRTAARRAFASLLWLGNFKEAGNLAENGQSGFEVISERI